MSQKYAIGAQGSGFISLQKPIADQSIYTPSISYQLDIFSGMICFGGNGRGFIIEVQTSANSNALTINPTRIPSAGRYILYASAPTGSDPDGIAVIDSNSVQDWDSYTGWVSGVDKEPWEGDDSSRRAIATFRVRIDSTDAGKLKIDPTSLRTINSFDHKSLHNILEDYGLYELNADTTEAHDFEYRGQGIIPEAVINEASPPTDKHLVYWNSTQNRYESALADDTEKEKVIGILDYQRDGVPGKNIVITGGIVNVGTTLLSSAIFPAGTYVYLDETVAGTYARDFDTWTNNNSYSLGDQLRITGSASTEYIVEVTSAGISEDPGPHDFTGTITQVGSTDATDGTVTWEAIAVWSPELFISRKVRIGISLGNGNLLFVPGGSASSTTDDHDESSWAHNFIQTAIEKAGIYIYDTNSGKNTRYWRGQYYDETATFTGSGIADDEIWAVYKNSGGHYLKADGANLAGQYVVGFCDRVTSLVGYVVSSGYFTFGNTSSWAVGDQLWLHPTTIGTITNVASDDTKVKVGTVITSDATEGIININIELDTRRALEEAGIFLDYTDSNYAFRGQSFDLVDKNTNTAFSGVSAGDVVYFASDGNYKPADDNGTVTAQWVGIADTARNRVYTSGYVTEPSGASWPAFTPGQRVYLSETAGEMLADSTTSDIFLGYAISANVILLKGGGGGNVSITQITDSSNTILNTTWSGVSSGNIVYNDAGTYKQAQDDGTIAERGWIGIADVSGGKIFTGGTVTVTGHGITIGQKAYLSNTAGDITGTKTNTVIGIATTANQILLAERNDEDQILHKTAITATGLTQYEAVYIDTNGQFAKAQSDGISDKWVGIATQLSATPGTSPDGIVILSGIVVLNDTILPDGTFNDGDEVFLNADGSFGNTSTSVKIGDVLDSATWKVILATGGGAGGTGDITSEDIQINNWLQSTPFNEAYFDTFVDLNTFGVIEAGVPSQDAVTFTNGTDIVNLTAHKLVLNDIIQFTTDDTLPAELSISTDYYIVEVDADDFKVSASRDGSAIDFTDDGTGPHYIQTLIQYNSADSNYYTSDVYGKPWASNEILNNNTAHAVDTVKSIGDEVVDARTANKWIWECVNVNAAYNEADTGGTIPTEMNAGSAEPTKGDKVIDNAVTWEAIRPATLYRFQVLHSVDDYDADAMKVYYSITTAEPGTWSTGTNWTEITDLTDLVYIPAGFTDLSIGFEFTNKQTLSSFAVAFDYNSNVYTSSTARLLETHTGTAYSVDDDITIPNNGRYTVDGKSLRVYLNGLKMIEGASADYVEKDNRTITWKKSGGILTGDDLEFTEDYGLVDFSSESWNALQNEHDTSGNHVYTDTVTSTQYQFSIVNGVPTYTAI